MGFKLGLAEEKFPFRWAWSSVTWRPGEADGRPLMRAYLRRKALQRRANKETRRETRFVGAP